MKTSKIEFFKILDSLKSLKGCTYWYCDSCNDPKSQERYQPKSAKYEFYLIGNEEILLESGSFIKSTHENKKEELIKKFSNWAKQWKNKKHSQS